MAVPTKMREGKWSTLARLGMRKTVSEREGRKESNRQIERMRENESVKVI